MLALVHHHLLPSRSAIAAAWNTALLLVLATGRIDAAEEFKQLPTVEPAREQRSTESSTSDTVPTPSGESLLPSITRDVFNVLPGFQVERLYDVPDATQGSWVCLTLDEKGRLLASAQSGQGIFRIAPAPIGSVQPTRVERLNIPVSGAQGMAVAQGSLYVSVHGNPGSIIRLRDTTGDDSYDEVVRLREFPAAGEHGPHGLRLSPDGQWIYYVCGNGTQMPPMSSSRVPTNWAEDRLLPYEADPFGFAKDVGPPGGFVCRFDLEAKNWELICTGLRNSYDIDFGPDGDLFTFDADMEDDMGTAWYRPTRVCHLVSGCDYGWRNGSGKWPPYYADTLPAVLDIGPGSPVGVVFGMGTRFPEKYQRAFYILDWSFGTIYAVHLERSGASWAGRAEEFLSRAPLPLTDAVVGNDGALYFTTGGRNLTSSLFRVTWIGDSSRSVAVPRASDRSPTDRRDLRRKLESFHRHFDDPSRVIDTAAKFLGHEDRYIRHAARIALEHQDVDSWRDAVFNRSDAQSVITGVVALARQGDASLRGALVARLLRLDFRSLSTQPQLEALRAYALVFTRMGAPGQSEKAAILDELDPLFPATIDHVNRELGRLLVYLESPTVIERTLTLMLETDAKSSDQVPELLARNENLGGKIARMISSGQEPQNVHYARILSNLRYGWTLEQRQTYFDWIRKAVSRNGGRSYQGYVENIGKSALENASEAERAALEATAPAPARRKADLPKPVGPGREWSIDEIVKLATEKMETRSFEKGRRTYAAVQCVLCHRFDGEGGATGPDLTNLGGRFSVSDIAETIIEPSKTIPDRYQATVIVTSSGDALTGRVVSETDNRLTLLVDPVDFTKTLDIQKADIVQRSLSPTSLMPTGLLNTLNEEELLDLVAFLISRGDPRDSVFSD